jgi:hypothetical protein
LCAKTTCVDVQFSRGETRFFDLGRSEPNDEMKSTRPLVILPIERSITEVLEKHVTFPCGCGGRLAKGTEEILKH